MKKIFKNLSIFLLIIAVWAIFIEPNMLIVKHYKIQNENLKGLKIVYATDFHFKNNEFKKLKKVIKKINRQDADIVLFGGDFVNGQIYEKTLHPGVIAKLLGDVNSKYGIYSVLGNHDCWLDENKVKDYLVKYGINVLSNQNKVINIADNRKIYIAGTEDLYTGKPDIKKTLANTSSPVILLSHSPDIFPEVPDFVDLTLAGHTHGGQVNIPFVGPVLVPSEYGQKYAAGLISEDKKQMIVSRGIGTSIIPIRFNCFPEIVVITFY